MKLEDLLFERFNNFKGAEKELLIAFYDASTGSGDSMKRFNMIKVKGEKQYKLRNSSNRKILKDLASLTKSGLIDNDGENYKISKAGIKAVDNMMIDNDGDIDSFKFKNDQFIIEP